MKLTLAQYEAPDNAGCGVRRFRPGTRATLLMTVLFGLAVVLALWQLNRADQKRVLQTGYIDSLGRLPMAPAALTGDQADHFARVRIVGRYQPRDFLVDNSVHNGRVGYTVVSAFLGDQGRVYLINRGWLAAPGPRDVLPVLPLLENGLEITAVVWPDTGLLPLLADDRWPDTWPKRVQRLNVERMRRALGGGYPFVLRLEADQPGAFEPTAGVPDLAPDRHLGYAVQWFALGSLAFVAWLVIGIRGAVR